MAGDNKVCRVGLVGAGVVGGGVVDVLRRRADTIARRMGCRVELVRVAEKDRDRALGTGISESQWVDDFAKVVEADDIDVVVELVGGRGVAGQVVRRALAAGKAVVTANKALLAHEGGELFALARSKKVPLAFEASVCGGIPLIVSLREGFVANYPRAMLGIVNGTCNYILTHMARDGVSFDACLADAQRKGFAEADPSADIDGLDSGHKLAILSGLAYDTWIDFTKMNVEGIRQLDDFDVSLARELGYTLKLLAVARPEKPTPKAEDELVARAGGRLFLSVHPALLRKDHPLATVDESFNAVDVQGDVVDDWLLYGRGAGRYPTASAVVSDIAQVARGRLDGSGAPQWWPGERPMYELAPMADYRSRFYLRFVVQDRPGVLGKIASAMGARGVSIAVMRQFEQPRNGAAVLVLLTHAAREGDVRGALTEVGGMDFIQAVPTLLRIEE